MTALIFNRLLSLRPGTSVFPYCLGSSVLTLQRQWAVRLFGLLGERKKNAMSAVEMGGGGSAVGVTKHIQGPWLYYTK